MPHKVQPGRWVYLLAAGIFGVGLAVFITKMGTALEKLPDAAGPAMSNVMSMGTSLERFVVPGHVDVTVAEPGRYVIYHEFRSTVAGVTYSSRPGSAKARCTITETATGALITAQKSAVNQTYDFPDYQGQSIWIFDAPAAGTYRVAATAASTTAGPIVLAVGPSMISAETADILTGTCFGSIVCLLCSVAALTIMIVGLVKRSRIRKQMAIPVATAAAMPPER